MGDVHANAFECEVGIVKELDVWRFDIVSCVTVGQTMVAADG